MPIDPFKSRLMVFFVYFLISCLEFILMLDEEGKKKIPLNMVLELLY